MCVRIVEEQRAAEVRQSVCAMHLLSLHEQGSARFVQVVRRQSISAESAVTLPRIVNGGIGGVSVVDGGAGSNKASGRRGTVRKENSISIEYPHSVLLNVVVA